MKDIALSLQADVTPGCFKKMTFDTVFRRAIHMCDMQREWKCRRCSRGISKLIVAFEVECMHLEIQTSITIR